MRRAFMIMTALLAAGAIFITVCVIKAHNNLQNVNMSEETLLGDRKLAENFKLTIPLTLDGHLNWDLHAAYKEGEFTSDVDYKYSLKDERHGSYETNAVNAWTDLTAEPFMDSDGHYDLDADYGILKAVREDHDKHPETPYGSVRVNIMEYYETYPLNVVFDIDGHYYESWNVVDRALEGTYEWKAIKGFSDYFQIPVMTEEYMTVEYTLDDEGELSDISYCYEDNTECYSIEPVCVRTESAIYMSISNLTSTGKYVDTSRIPDGYGIYRIPYEIVDSDEEDGECLNVRMEDIECIYQAGEKETIVELFLNKQKDAVLALTLDDGYYCVKSIDLENGNILMNETICKNHSSYPSELSVQRDGGVLIHFLDNTECFVSEDDNGNFKFELVFELPEVYTGAGIGLANGSTDCDFAWDGERLGILDYSAELYDQNTKDCAFVTVCTKDGIQYIGRIDSSLKDANNYREGGQYFGSYGEYNGGLIVKYQGKDIKCSW